MNEQTAMALHAIYFIWISLESLTLIAYTIFSINFCTVASARSRYNNNDEPCLASMQFCVVITQAETHILPFYSVELIASQYFMRRWQFTWTHLGEGKAILQTWREKTPFKKILAIKTIWRYFSQFYRSQLASVCRSIISTR